MNPKSAGSFNSWTGFQRRNVSRLSTIEFYCIPSKYNGMMVFLQPMQHFLTFVGGFCSKIRLNELCEFFITAATGSGSICTFLKQAVQRSWFRFFANNFLRMLLLTISNTEKLNKESKCFLRNRFWGIVISKDSGIPISQALCFSNLTITWTKNGFHYPQSNTAIFPLISRTPNFANQFSLPLDVRQIGFPFYTF